MLLKVIIYYALVIISFSAQPVQSLSAGSDILNSVFQGIPFRGMTTGNEIEKELYF